LIDVLQMLLFRVGHAVRVSVYRERPPSAPVGLVTAVSDFLKYIIKHLKLKQKKRKVRFFQYWEDHFGS